MNPRGEGKGHHDGLTVVTGGASGIGLALARAYLKRGLRVLIADLQADRVEEATNELDRGQGRVFGHVTDVVNQSAVDELAARARKLGPVMAVCMNAGVTAFGPATWDISPRSFSDIMNVNLGGLFNSIRCFVPLLKAQEIRSSIIITGSMAGLVSSPYSAAYAASKAAVVAVAKALRGELEVEAPHVAVTMLAPGMVQSNLFRSSLTVLTDGPTSDPETAEAAHEVLNGQGVSPDEAASWALESSDDGEFWALPPAGDTFCDLLRAEVDQLRERLGR